MFDVFYQGPKPNLFPFEHAAENLDDAAKLSRTKFFWFIDGNNDYTNFDFNFRPVPWEEDQIHVFSSQWQDNGRTYLAKKTTAHLKQWNWHNTPKVTATDNHVEIVYIDHGNRSDSLVLLNQKYPTMRITRFIDSYLGTLRRIMNSATADYVWVVSSLCDYSTFDFSWHPSQWQQDMLHVFPSNSESKGDTFYVNTKKFKEQAPDLELLDWFDTVNYCEDQRVKRCNVPVVSYDGNNLVAAVKNYEFTYPYAIFSESDIKSVPVDFCMWNLKTRAVTALTPSGSVSLIPRDVKTYLTTQIYDYPYINKQNLLQDPAQDIIFISYDEPNADENWAILSSKFPHARRLHGVEGMENALLKAAEMSRTKWYYAVFAKTELHPDFDFEFRPDLFQQPKHYIFHAENPLNGLRYGHMGVVLYNCDIVKNIKEFGIDYTMSSLHAVVPITSAIARFNSNPYQTWRTAFREAGKLAQFCDEKDNVENNYRLNVWTSEAAGLHSEWCLQGARDGVIFYEANKENKTQLKNAFNWVWLREYFTSLYKNADDPDLNELQQRQLLWQQR
jgi:hypothetical protein